MPHESARRRQSKEPRFKLRFPKRAIINCLSCVSVFVFVDLNSDKMADQAALAADAMNAGVAALHRVHSFLDIRVCYLLVIGGMAIIGGLKAAGKMPHLMSKPIGRGLHSFTFQPNSSRV